MRWYSIQITDPDSGALISAPGFAGLLGYQTYGSLVNGVNLPNAWNVELEIPVTVANQPAGNAIVRVWGISLAEIAQSNDLGPNIRTGRPGKNIAVYGGMRGPGLPLQKPEQSGLLVSGTILQCYGNWIGNNMTLDFVIMVGPASSSNIGGTGSPSAVNQKSEKALTLQWQGGQPLGPALKQSLQTAFPGYTVNVKINDGIVARSGDSPFGFSPTLKGLSKYAFDMSRSIIKTPGYPGVQINVTGTTINVYDAPQGASKAIAFEDMIGQPTWIESPNIQVKTVMRADLTIWTPFTLPQTLITNTQQANSSLVNQRSNFQGGFYVASLFHYGNFRQSTADSWVTVIEGVPQMVS